MHTPAPLAIHDFQPGELSAVVEFLKRARSELRSLHRALVWADKFQVFDINRDYFEVRGIGYGDADIVPILDAVNAAYNPDTIHAAIAEPYKEFSTGRRYPWAQDRVM
jgi:hypothetical protein